MIWLRYLVGYPIFLRRYFGSSISTVMEDFVRSDGSHFMTPTLSVGSLCHLLTQNVVFIDRDGTHFRHILNWLRDGVVPLLDPAGYQELLREAQFYQLNVGFQDKLHLPELNRGIC